ncbi:MAG TPA: 4-hydroxy-3-methylbut-2-enyl diphosphate reductase, partial [Thermoanaerobaculia bacterium]|nr:4-hydroxy-3-methylbut-2-enyl diphosphate reductase [Thermoanaerobaculia bacterium]
MTGPSSAGSGSRTPAVVRVEKLLVAGLRGFCAGVVRAIDVVDRALQVCESPVYVRKEIIHNRYVV